MKETGPFASPPKLSGSPPLRRRTRSFSSSASSYSATPPSPSPYHPLASSLPRASSIPFSWERKPGIPKIPTSLPTPPSDTLLPLPPPLRSNSDHRKKRADPLAADPFAAALAECAKDVPAPAPSELDEFWRRGTAAAARRRALSVSLTDRFGLIGLYGSCKASCSVSDSTVRVPRAANRTTAGYGLLNRRST